MPYILYMPETDVQYKLIKQLYNTNSINKLYLLMRNNAFIFIIDGIILCFSNMYLISKPKIYQLIFCNYFINKYYLN